MREEGYSFTAVVCRRLLRVLGLGAAGTMTIFASVAASDIVVSDSDKVFAKQFVSNGTPLNLPKMVYDRNLQMMVDPLTLLPVYEDAKKLQIASGLPTITAGCGDCPKKDDDGS